MRIFVVIALTLIGCAGPKNGDEATTAAVRPWQWPMSDPQAEGFELSSLDSLFEAIRSDDRGDFYSLLVTKQGRIAVEQYFNGHDRDSLHDIRSAGKSISSILVGIAIGDGVLPAADSPVRPLFAEYEPFANEDARKDRVTIANLLSMSSGLDADEDDPSSAGYEDRLWESGDWTQFVLNLEMVNEPGAKWSYASANTFLLGAAIEERAGMTLSEYADGKLFGPLDISRYRWASNPAGRTVAQGNLSVRARDMAKFGQLILNQGSWLDKRIVSSSWVEASIEPKYEVPWDGYDGYGYCWYSHTLVVDGRSFSYYFASGNGGNKIYAFPSEEMVVVIQSAAYNTNYGQRRSLDVLTELLKTLVA